MILAVVNRHGWDDVRLWKMNLKGAFNLLWFQPDQVQLFAFPLTDDLVAIHLVGIFGWLGMPFAFNVLFRALLLLIRQAIYGAAAMYVDDVMGCSPANTLDTDMDRARTAITGLAGEDRARTLPRIYWLGYLPRLSHNHRPAPGCYSKPPKLCSVSTRTIGSPSSSCSG